MKYLVVEMSDKTQWAIPAKLIAINRAQYYAQLETERGNGEYEDVFAKEVKYAMSDEHEITDWAANNMNWKDVYSHAIQLTTSHSVDYYRDWINAPMSVKELFREDN
ncbi:MAG: hypothetical protein H8D45_27885 [Bacteroidetes bacterium]|nr:hypothetical protein [Bacteroidota bacterium]